jgi:hypothetical protein
VPPARPLVTLLTDFGDHDYFVASMKGVILSINPDCRLVDISHQIAPHQIEQAGYALHSCYRYYPDGTVHVAVVDPGVGSHRRALLVSAARYYFLAPDNGTLFSMSASPWIRSGMALAEPVGRNALPTFIVQFMVYYTGFYMVVTRGDGVTPSAAAVIWLISIMMLWGFAKTCEQYKISRFITVGLFSLIPARRQYSGAAAFDSQGCWSCTGEPLRTTGSALATGLSGSRSGHRRNRQREVNR